MVHAAFILIWSPAIPRALVCAAFITGFPVIGLGLSLEHGAAVIDYDRAAWDAVASGTGLPPPVLTLTAFFDADAASTLSYSELLKVHQSQPAYSGQVYRMTGASVTNLPQRTLPPTTFEYSKGHLDAPTGAIGLAGVSQFTVASGGVLLFGDFTLAHDVGRIPRGGSGWYLRGHIPPAAPAFDLLDVELSERDDGFSISASLAVSFEVANFLFATSSDALRVVGRFRFEGWTPVEVISPPVLSVAIAALDRVDLTVSNGVPGMTFVVVSASAPGAEADRWEVVATGRFDAEGRAAASVSHIGTDGGRYFRVRLP